MSSISLGSSSFVLYIPMGMSWVEKEIRAICALNKFFSFPGKCGLVMICLSRSPVKIYFIYFAALMWSGNARGSSVHSESKFVEQK